MKKFCKTFVKNDNSRSNIAFQISKARIALGAEILSKKMKKSLARGFALLLLNDLTGHIFERNFCSICCRSRKGFCHTAGIETYFTPKPFVVL